MSLAGSEETYSWDDIDEPVNSSFDKKTAELMLGPGKIKLTKWGTDSFFAVRTRYTFNSPIQIIREIHGTMVWLCFMSKGISVYQHGRLFSEKMHQHTNNLFCIKNVKTVCEVEKDEKTESFDILISPDYIKSLAERHSCLFEKLYGKIQKEEPFGLCQNHLVTTPEMSRIIEQIKKLPLKNKTASLFFEAKVQELLALQLEQAEKQTCGYCSNCFIRYRDQLNEARNIIEQHYKNPPGIHELALMVGMCDTQLKAGFKFLFNHTIYGYLFEYRMNMAQCLLKETSGSIADIADHTGYEHQSHFTTAFKRKFGITPREYRNEYVSLPPTA